MKSTKHRPGTFTRRFLIIVFTILAIPVLVLAFSSSPLGDYALRTFAERAIGRALSLPVSVRRLHVSMLSRVWLEGLRIDLKPPSAGAQTLNTTGFSQETTLSVDSARIDIKLLPLLKGRLRIGLFEVNGLRLPVDEIGAAGGPAAGPLEALLPFPVRVDRLLLESVHVLTGGTDLPVSQVESGPIQGDARSLSAEHLVLSLPGTEITGQAAVRRTAGGWPLEGQFLVRGMPNPLLASLGVPVQSLGTRRELRLTVDLSGQITQPMAAIRGDLPAMEVAGFAFTGGQLRARWPGDRLEVEELELRAAQGRLLASGTLFGWPWRLEGLRVHAEHFSVAPLWLALLREPPPFLGTLEASLAGSGLLSQPADSPPSAIWDSLAAEAEITIADLQYNGSGLAPVAVRIGLRDGAAQGSLTQAANSITFQVETHNRSMTGRFSAQVPRLEPIAALVSVNGLTGSLQADGTFKDSLQSPLATLSGTFMADLRHAAYGSIRIDDANVTSHLEDGRVFLDALRLRQGDLRISASGAFNTRALEGTLQADLAGGTGKGGVGGAGGTGGTGKGGVGGAGGTVDVRAAAAEEQRGKLSMSFAREGTNLHVTISGEELTGTKARLDASALIGLQAENGALQISPGSSFTGSLSAKRVDVGVASSFLPAGIKAGGDFSCNLGWSGTLEAPNPAGTLSLSGGSFRAGGGTPPVEQLRLTAAVHDRALDIERLSATVQGIPVYLQGTVRTADFRQADVELNATLSHWGSMTVAGTVSAQQIALESRIRSLDLQAVGLLVPALHTLSGALSGTLSARGALGNPQVSGTAEASDLGLSIPGLPASLSGGAFRLSFQGRQVKVESLSARLGGGTIAVGGTLSWQPGGLESADLAIRLRDFALKDPGVYSLAIRSADLRYFGQKDQFTLDGDIVPGDSRLEQDLQPQALVAYLRSAERPSTPMPLFLAKTRLDVRMHDADNIWMQNNLGRVRLQAALSIQGMPSLPVVAGRVTVVEGYVVFLDRRFDITQGTVDFEDPRRLNPVIDLEANASVSYSQALASQPYQISLTLKGPMDTLQVGLTSDPPLSRDNIISLLALGTIRPESEGGIVEQRSAAQILMQRAGELASSGVTQFIGKGVKALLGLDQFSVTGNLFNIASQQNTPMISASKKITDRLEITYSTNLGLFSEHDLSMDLKLSDAFSLQGKLNQAGDAEVKLKLGIKLK